MVRSCQVCDKFAWLLPPICQFALRWLFDVHRCAVLKSSHPLAGTATDKTVAVITERGQASLRRVFEAERARRFVVSKHLAKARQRDDGAQGLFGFFLGHMVFELVLEPRHRGSMT